MTEWSAVVLAPPEGEDGPMISRLPSYLHPVAGRPLLWHTVRALLECDPLPQQVIVLAPPEFASDLFEDLPGHVETWSFDYSGAADVGELDLPSGPVLVSHASTFADRETLERLLRAPIGSWWGQDESVGAALLTAELLVQQLCLREPLAFGGPSLLNLERRLEIDSESFRVRTRADLARVHRRVRDDLVLKLMEQGVTFLLPDSVLVDVDVRIGRDTIVYPGACLEGQTTVGAETVIGPGCRVIDSWIGSGVELKGWNYIAHTSVRNRAILEPYVRRGFD